MVAVGKQERAESYDVWLRYVGHATASAKPVFGVDSERGVFHGGGTSQPVACMPPMLYVRT